MFKKFVFFTLIIQTTTPFDKRFNEVRMIMTHNATSLRPTKSTLGDTLRQIVHLFPLPKEARIKILNAIHRITIVNPNPVADQVFPLETQLKDGVRAFKLPISKCNDEFHVCHTISKEKAHELYNEADEILSKIIPIKKLRNLLLTPLAKFRDNPCLIDTTHTPLNEVLITINKWLEKNTHEVICIFFDFSQFSKEMEQKNLVSFGKLLYNTGILNKMYTHTPNKPWPTLKNMHLSNKRVVIIANSSGFNTLGILNKKALGFGSTYKYKELNDLAKDSKNPKIDWGIRSKNNLFIIDNYTTPYISGNIIDAKQANSYKMLTYRIKQYEKLAKQPASFIMIDFYHLPHHATFKVINDLNNA